MGTLAILASLLAGFLYGTAVFVQKRGLASGAHPLTGAFITIATMAAMFWAGAPAMIDWSWWATPAAAAFAVCGLLFPAAGQSLQMSSVKAVGPALTSAIGAFTPLFAALPAALFLHEEMNLQAAAGMAALILGLLMASFIGKGARWGASAVLLLIPLGAALARGVVQPLAKWGYIQGPSPYFGTLVMATVSTVVLGAVVAWRPAARRRPSARVSGVFALNGVMIGTGIFVMQYGISHGEVMIVAPLVALTPIWTLLFGALVFRSEQLTWRHAAVAALVFAGSVLIVTR